MTNLIVNSIVSNWTAGGLLLLCLVACHDAQRENPFDPELTPPVENVEATLNDSSGIAVVEWDAYAGAQTFDHYLVLRKVQGLEAVDTLKVIADQSETRFEDATIGPETDYTYRITVVNTAGFAWGEQIATRRG